MEAKPKRTYHGQCVKCREYKEVTFRSSKKKNQVKIEVNKVTGEEKEVVKTYSRRFAICFDCLASSQK